MQRLAILAALLIATSGVYAVSPALQVSLRAEAPKTIPGIPVDIRIVLTNSTNAEVELPDNDVMLRVERAGQAPFWALDGLKVSGHAAFRLPPCADRPEEGSLLPHTSIEYALDGDPGASKSWWEDPKLNVPGVYRLQVVFQPPDWAHGGKRPADFLSDSALGPDALISRSLTVIVEEPHGADAVVWERLTAAMPDKELRGTLAIAWADAAVAEGLLQAYPGSRYAPWLEFRLRKIGDPEFRDEFRQKYANSPLLEVLDLEIFRARRSSLAAKPNVNVQDVASLRSEMNAVAQTAKHPVIRCFISNEMDALSKTVLDRPAPNRQP